MSEQVCESLEAKVSCLAEANGHICSQVDALAALAVGHQAIASLTRDISAYFEIGGPRRVLFSEYETDNDAMRESVVDFACQSIRDDFTTSNVVKIRELFAQMLVRECPPLRCCVPARIVLEVQKVAREAELGGMLSTRDSDSRKVLSLSAFREKAIKKEKEMRTKHDSLRALTDNISILRRNPPCEVVSKFGEFQKRASVRAKLKTAVGEKCARIIEPGKTLESRKRFDRAIKELSSVRDVSSGLVMSLNAANQQLINVTLSLKQLEVVNRTLRERTTGDMPTAGDVHAWMATEESLLDERYETEGDRIFERSVRVTTSLCERLRDSDNRWTGRGGHAKVGCALTAARKRATNARSRVDGAMGEMNGGVTRVVDGLTKLSNAVAVSVAVWEQIGDDPDLFKSWCAHAGLEWADAVCATITSEIQRKQETLSALETHRSCVTVPVVRPLHTSCVHKKDVCITVCGHTFCEACITESHCPVCDAAFSPSDVISIVW